jgi:hypothetical protein
VSTDLYCYLHRNCALVPCRCLADAPSPSRCCSNSASTTSFAVCLQLSLADSHCVRHLHDCCRHEGEDYLLTGDRAEHARVSRFPCTPLIQAFLTGHSDYLTAVAAGPHAGTALTAAADGTVSVWDLLGGACHCSVDIEALLKAAGTSGSSSSSAVALAAVSGKAEAQATDSTAAAGEQNEQQQGSSPARSARKRPLAEVSADAAADDSTTADSTATSGAAAAAAASDDGTEAAAAAAEDDEEGEGEGGSGASPPSRAVYPTALAVQPGGSGLVAVAVCGVQGVVAVLRISSSSSSASAAGSSSSQCEIAHTLQLGSTAVGEVQAVAFAAGFLFVVAEGPQCVQACTVTDY